MSVLSDIGVAGGGGGATIYEPHPLTHEDLVGTSTYDAETGILSVPGGAIVRLVGEGGQTTWQRPTMTRTRVKWSSRLNSTPDVYMVWREDTGDDADFQGYALRFKWSGSLGWSEMTGTLASPTKRDDGSTSTLTGGLGDDEWGRIEFSNANTTGTAGYAYGRLWKEGADALSRDQATDATDVVGDWSGDASPAPTVEICFWNEGTDTVDIDLFATYIDLAEERRDGVETVSSGLVTYATLAAAEAAIATGNLTDGIVQVTGHGNVYRVVGGQWTPNHPLTQTLWDTAHLGVWSEAVPYGFKGVDGAVAGVDGDGRIVIDNITSGRSHTQLHWIGSKFGRFGMIEAWIERTTGSFNSAANSFWVGVSESQGDAEYTADPTGYFAYVHDTLIGALVQTSTTGALTGIATSETHGVAGPSFRGCLVATPRTDTDGDTTSEGVFFAGLCGDSAGLWTSQFSLRATDGWDPDEAGYVAANYTLALALGGSSNTVRIDYIGVGTPALYQY